MSLDPECLKAFVAVEECGGFTRAADALNRTQAAVSQQVKKLEERLGVRLFERHSRQVVLSSHGHVLIGYARQLLALQDETLKAFSKLETPQVIRLGAPDDYATSFMPSIINSFSHSHPLAAIEVQCALSVELIDSLQKREIDLALVTRLADSTEGEDVRSEKLVWVSAPQAMVHTREVLPLALFSSTDKKCSFRYGSLKQLDEARRDYCITYTSRSTAVLLSAVRAGLAIAVLAESSVPPDLIILDEKDGLPPLPGIRIALHKRAGRRDPIIDEFSDHVVKVLSSDASQMQGILE